MGVKRFAHVADGGLNVHQDQQDRYAISDCGAKHSSSIAQVSHIKILICLRRSVGWSLLGRSFPDVLVQ